jgi:hypothetical protein
MNQFAELKVEQQISTFDKQIANLDWCLFWLTNKKLNHQVH